MNSDSFYYDSFVSYCAVNCSPFHRFAVIPPVRPLLGVYRFAPHRDTNAFYLSALHFFIILFVQLSFNIDVYRKCLCVDNGLFQL